MPLLSVLLWSALQAQAAPFTGQPGDSFAVDAAQTPFRVAGAVKSFRPAGPDGGTLAVELRGSMLGKPGKWGELTFDLARTPLPRISWGNRARVKAELRVSPEFVGAGKRNWYRAHRARLFLVDGKGRRMFLPNRSIVDRPPSSDGWLPLEGFVSADVPMPLGHTDPGFDARRVRALGVNVEAFNREGEVVRGTIELRRLAVAFEEAVAPRVLPPDPAVLAGEAERAARMNARLDERCAVGRSGMAVGVNLAWPTARSPDGEDMQLYGKLLDGGERWWNRHWDLGDDEVLASVRRDFREIRAVFGERALVRLWIFSDLRTGVVFDGAGNVVRASDRAVANMKRLLALALEEKVVLIPVLLDFLLADGVARTGPDGAWKVSERPDLVTDPARRARLVKAMEDFVRPFAGHPAVLAWDVMNEPDNAAGVVTPAHFADVQTLLRELVEAVHRAGDLATVGHRNVPDPREFFHGRIPYDLGQVHYYPLVETRPNPTPFGVKLGPTFGPLPAGWGELQAIPGRSHAQLAAAQRAGHRLFLFWAWRGHLETGDGFAVQPLGDEIKRALARLRRS